MILGGKGEKEVMKMFIRKLTFQNLLCRFIFIGLALALTVSAQGQNLVWAKPDRYVGVGKARWRWRWGYR